jgi:hypothetical protein
MDKQSSLLCLVKGDYDKSFMTLTPRINVKKPFLVTYEEVN